VASFLPVDIDTETDDDYKLFSSLSESGFIPTELVNLRNDAEEKAEFSSLSESGFIPTC